MPPTEHFALSAVLLFVAQNKREPDESGSPSLNKNDVTSLLVLLIQCILNEGNILPLKVHHA